MLRVVIDTNIWVRALKGGPISLPILVALREGRFQLLLSDYLVEELRGVLARPRVRRSIELRDIDDLLTLIETRAEWVTLKTPAPHCRDPKDEPVLSTAIDGRADAIVTGDSDLRADDPLRAEMAAYGVQLWGVQALIDAVHTP